MIGMAVREQNQIHLREGGQFLLCFFKNRIRNPGIHQQHFSPGGDNLESRLAIPGK